MQNSVRKEFCYALKMFSTTPDNLVLVGCFKSGSLYHDLKLIHIYTESIVKGAQLEKHQKVCGWVSLEPSWWAWVYGVFKTFAG